MGKTFSTGLLTNGLWQDASNNIGIGGSPSGTYKLEVTGTAKVSSTLLVGGALTGSAVATFTAAANPLILKSTSATTGYTEYYYNTSTLAGIIGNGGGILTGANNSDFIIRSEADFVVATGGNNRRLTIASGGNVGIGITTPSAKLDLGSNFGTAGTINKISLYNTGTTPTYGFGISAAQLDYVSVNDHVFYTGATLGERMRITSGGVTLFGGTTFTTITSAVLGATNPSFTGRNWSFGPNSSGDYVVYHNQGGGNTGVYLTYGGSSWTSNSDENIKDIIEIIPNALESIKDLRAVKFYWKGDESKKENLGLIAQDVQKSYPQLIDKQINDNNEVLGVRYTEVIPILVKAIQEMNTKLDEQNQLITSLQDRLDKAGL